MRCARFNSGVTLIELLIVLTLIALVTGISYPSAAAGVESLRLRSVSDQVVNFLNTAIDRAGRREQVIEVWIAPKDNVLIARSPDLEFSRRLELPDGYRILAVLPAAEVNPDRAAPLPHVSGRHHPAHRHRDCKPRREQAAGERRPLHAIDARGKGAVMTPHRDHRQSRTLIQHGFTLLEVLVATLIMGIAVAGHSERDGRRRAQRIPPHRL